MPAADFARQLSANRYFPDPPGIVTAVEVGVLITFIKYRPQSKPLAYPPQAPSVTCGDSSLPEGAIGCVPFHIGLCFQEVPPVESLSQKSKIFASSLSQGSLFVPGIVSAVVVEAPHQSPPCQRGVVWRSQTGGIPQGSRFPHRLVLLRKHPL